MKTENDNRARLLNMAAGGNGQVTPWIERVTLDDTPTDGEQHGFVVHVPQRATRGGTAPAIHVNVSSIDAARGLLHAIDTGAQPRDTDTTEEELRAQVDAIPYTDNGRHVQYDSKA